MQKKLCGIDLNGVQDYAARNWVKAPSGEDKFDEHVNLGSTRSSIIDLNTQKGFPYIGGVQAELAPHGRGDGYGSAIGDSELRTYLSDIIKSEYPDIDKLQAALLGITPTADYAICGIPDSVHTTEAYREALLFALRRAKFKNPLLVWRSVLVCLAAVEREFTTRPCSVGVISHSNSGLDIQTLELKFYRHENQDILVPERKKLGHAVNATLGYDSLFDEAIKNLQSICVDPFLDVMQSKNIALLGLGRNARSELLRSRTGLWKELMPPASLNLASLGLEEHTDTIRAYLQSCDIILFETFTEGRLQSQIQSSIESVLGRDIELLCDDTIAKAALFAAHRYAKNIPIYFDFLPQISTIVQKGRKPTNHDLINQSEKMLAGAVYRSKDPAIFGTQAGQTEIEVYLKKEEVERPRKATFSLPYAATSVHSVSVYVEQTPAQGKASIQINSVDLNLSQLIDFQEAEELDATWEDLLTNIKVGSVPIPERVVLPAFLDNWGDDIEYGLTYLIKREVNEDEPDWGSLERKIGRAVSSDGDLPNSISQQTDADLHVLTQKALKHFVGRMEGRISANNLSLRFLTWQFKRCPQEVCARLIDFWGHYGEENFRHSIIRNVRSWNLLFQGVGRAVFGPDLEQRALYELLSTPVERWHWEAQTACASFLVSRSKIAHKLLDLDLIENFLKRIKIEFRANLRSNYREFRYAPFLLAGLLRYREVDPQFLVLGNDPRADALITMIDKTLDDISKSRIIKNYERSKYNYWLSEILKFIRCEGGNARLLMDISNNLSRSTAPDNKSDKETSIDEDHDHFDEDQS
jgi:hypothetical protein